MQRKIWGAATVRFEKVATINIGQFNSVKVGVSDSPSFQQCDKVIIEELKRLDIPVNDRIKAVLQWQE